MSTAALVPIAFAPQTRRAPRAGPELLAHPIHWLGQDAQRHQDRRFGLWIVGSLLLAGLVVALLPDIKRAARAPELFQTPLTIELPPTPEPAPLPTPPIEAPAPKPTVAPPQPLPAPPKPQPVLTPKPAPVPKPEAPRAARPTPKPEPRPEPVRPQPTPVPVPVQPPQPTPEQLTQAARQKAAQTGVNRFADQLRALSNGSNVATSDVATTRRTPTLSSNNGSNLAADSGELAAEARNSASRGSGGIGGPSGGGNVSGRESRVGTGGRNAASVAAPRASGSGRPGRGGNGNGADASGENGGSNAGGGGTKAGKRIRSQIDDVVERNRGRFNAAHERALRDNPDIDGNIRIGFTIDPDGSVSNVHVVSSDIADEAFVAKIVTLVKGLNFGAKDVEPFTVSSYNFTFQAPAH